MSTILLFVQLLDATFVQSLQIIKLLSMSINKSLIAFLAKLILIFIIILKTLVFVGDPEGKPTYI